MKIAVINFSGNVGKTTVAQHLLMPRMPPGAELIHVESINDGESQAQTLRGHQFGHLQEFLQTVDHAVVDIGASNVEELLRLMRSFQGSHEDFDAFIVPTTAPLKQQIDTIATLVDLCGMGVPAHRMKLVFNMVDGDEPITQAFQALTAFLAQRPIAVMNPSCALSINEIYGRMDRGHTKDLMALASDPTDFKAAIAMATSAQDKLTLARRLATCRLARGVLPELDACFAALALGEMQPTSRQDDCAEATT